MATLPSSHEARTHQINGKKNVKILLVLVDGIGDIGMKDHDNKTALQIANLPIFDAIAESG